MSKKERPVVVIRLNIGNTWDEALLHGVPRILEEFGGNVIVAELYGSVAGDPIGSARPDFRLPAKTSRELELFISNAHDAGLQINYTANLSCIGDIAGFMERLPSIRRYLVYLESLGVDRITVAHPLLMDAVSNETAMPIEISTICGVETLSEISVYTKSFRVDKICMDIYRNRDVGFLRDSQAVAASASADVELIVNEFCTTFGSPCIYRRGCFDLHAHGGNRDKLAGNYPMGICVASRHEVAHWLRAKFILPEDVAAYHDKTGIRCFKVTGRTHPTSKLLA
ncbi:MAG TPA: hypothetical protein VMQ44_02280 [Candidatus Saccharimonadales bacterium]|nr:hypothetical protein [Candidatus Saccharimonadales bacterium]